MEETKLPGTVLAVSGNKTLLLVNGREYYILRNRKSDSIGQTIVFNKADGLMMPSYMFAVAAMAEDDLDSTLENIKSSWYGSGK